MLGCGLWGASPSPSCSCSCSAPVLLLAVSGVGCQGEEGDKRGGHVHALGGSSRDCRWTRVGFRVRGFSRSLSAPGLNEYETGAGPHPFGVPPSGGLRLRGFRLKAGANAKFRMYHYGHRLGPTMLHWVFFAALRGEKAASSFGSAVC